MTNDKKIVILSIDLDEHSYSKHEAVENSVDVYSDNIFYMVVSKDYNQNEYLDDSDSHYLFVSDREGNNFRQWSPDNYNIISWTALKGTTYIIMQAQKDNNNDKRFNQIDSTIPLLVDITTGKFAQETFNQNYLDSIKKVFSNIWKTESK